jgi:hypothetical protein
MGGEYSLSASFHLVFQKMIATCWKEAPPSPTKPFRLGPPSPAVRERSFMRVRRGPSPALRQGCPGKPGGESICRRRMPRETEVFRLLSGL